MKGTIKTYIHQKRYGFILGEDEQEYFFHTTALADRSQLSALCDAAEVEFEPVDSEKGPQAQNLKLLNTEQGNRYVVPGEVYVSKGKFVKGWQVVDWGEWEVIGSSAVSSEEAKDQAKSRAASLGANALLELAYFKSTDAQGNELHNFRGRIANIGKKHAEGEVEREALMGINQNAELVKQQQDAETHSRKLRRQVVWALGLIATVIAAAMQYWLLAGGIAVTAGIVGWLLGQGKTAESWLNKLPPSRPRQDRRPRRSPQYGQRSER